MRDGLYGLRTSIVICTSFSTRIPSSIASALVSSPCMDRRENVRTTGVRPNPREIDRGPSRCREDLSREDRSYAVSVNAR